MKKSTVKPRKFLAFFLALLMCFSLLPTMTFAATDDVTFTKVDTVEAGNEYLIVASSSSGSTYALANDSNIKMSVSPSNETITLSASNAAKATWTTAEATGDALAKGALIFTNNSKALNRNGSQNAVGFGTETTDARYRMSFTNGTLCNLNSSDTPYYLGYGSTSGSSSYTFRFADSATDNITFYQKAEGEGGSEEGGGEQQETGKTVEIAATKTTAANGSATIAVGETLTIKVTHNSRANKNFTNTVANGTVAQITSGATISDLASDETGTVVVKGLTGGTTDVTLTGSSNSGSDYIAIIHLTVTGEGGSEEGGGEQQDEPTPDNKTFTYASTVTEGKEYLLVSNGYALANASGTSVNAAKVTVNNNQIVLDANAAEYEEMLWTAGTSTSYTTQGTYTFQNGSDYFVRETNTNNAKTATTLNAYSVWTYDGSNLSQKNSSGQYTFYATYNSGFTVDVQQANSAELKLYVLDEGGTTPSGDEPTPPAPTGEAVYIGFTSDVHGNTTGLENWFKNLPAAIDLKNMGYCGDYSYSNGSSYKNDFDTIVSLTNTNVGINSGVYTTGNHCWSNGGSSVVSQMEGTTGFVRLGEATNVTTDAYEVYCFGAYQGDGIGGFQQSDINALDTYLNNHKSVPVFILSHYPLHYISSRTISKADAVIDVLNKYPNAVFVWGHNHSQSGESHYGEIKSFGDSIQYGSNSTSTIKEINFTYVCAGAGNNSQGLYDGCVAKVDGTEITFYYYDSTGDMATIKNRSVSSYTVDISDGSTTPGGDDPVTPPTPSGKNVNVTPTTSNPTGELTIAVGETGTITVVNGGSSQYTFSASVSGGSSYASVSPASQSIAQDGSATFTVTGLAAGTATISIQNNNSYSSQYTRKATITVNVTGEGGDEPGGDDPVTPPTPSGKTVSVEPTTSNPTGELTIAVGETGTITVVNGGSSQYTFSASVSGGSSYASVSPASQSIAQAGSAAFTVTGLAAGTATISIQNNNSYSSQYTRKATITVNVTGEGGDEPGGDDPVVSGDQYLIIENGYALSSKTTGSYTTSGGSYSGYQGVKYTAGTTEVTADMLWNVEMNGNSYTISQNGQYLTGSYTSGSSATGTLTLGTTPAIWTYSNNHLTIGSGNLTHSDGTNGVSGNPNVFSMRSSSNAGDVQFVKYQGEVTPGGDDPIVPSGDVTYVAFTSDVHNQGGSTYYYGGGGQENVSATRLNNWINTVTGKLNAPFDKMGFCGDMGPASGSDFWTRAQIVMDTVSSNRYILNGGFYVCGNHEYNPGSYTHNSNSTTQNYSDAGDYYVGSDYILYSMGARQYNEEYHDADITAMTNYLDANADFDGPIFVLTHFPVHCYGSYSSGESTSVHDGRAAVGAGKLVAALNAAAEENGQTIILLWGHNHSSSNDHYDAVYIDKINNTPISFTYAAAGCMSDSEYGQSANVKGKGLVAGIYEDCVTLTYYDANGNVIGRPAKIALDRSEDPSATYYTITASAGANGAISPDGESSVKEGKSKTFTFTANAGYELDTVTVDGETVSVSGNKYEFTNVAADHTISVSFKKAAVTVYEAATAAGTGSYVLVSNGYALYNNNGTISAVPVTENGNKISVNNSDIENVTWTFSAATGSEKSGEYEIKNNGYYFTRISDASGSETAAGITRNPQNSEASGLPYYQWSYDAANGRLSHIGGQDQSATFYAFYNTSAGAFYTTTDAQTLKLYVVSTEEPEVTPDVENKTDDVASYEFEDDLLVVDCSMACIVLAKCGDDYELLTAAKVDDDTYTFDYSGISGEFTLIIAIKGDANMDGEIDMRDATAAMMSWVNEQPLEDPVANLAANVNGDNEINMSDATAIMMSWVNETGFDWN